MIKGTLPKAGELSGGWGMQAEEGAAEPHSTVLSYVFPSSPWIQIHLASPQLVPYIIGKIATLQRV